MVREVSRLRRVVIISLDICYSLDLCLFAGDCVPCRVGACEDVCECDDYLFKENKLFLLSHVHGMFFVELYLCCLMNDFEITKTMNMLHYYLCWLHMNRFVNVPCSSSAAFRQSASSLYGW